MAARGRRTDRATIKSSGRVLYRTSLRDADRRTHSGELHWCGNNTYTEIEAKSETPTSSVNLTEDDMQGVVNRLPRALNRVRHWPLVFNTRSLTIIAGRGAWVPDPSPDRIQACSKLMEQASRAKRYADTSRN